MSDNAPKLKRYALGFDEGGNLDMLTYSDGDYVKLADVQAQFGQADAALVFAAAAFAGNRNHGGTGMAAQVVALNALAARIEALHPDA